MHAMLHFFFRDKGLSLAGQYILLELSLLTETFTEALLSFLLISAGADPGVSKMGREGRGILEEKR